MTAQGSSQPDHAREALEQVCARGDLNRARELYAEDFIDHVNALDYRVLARLGYAVARAQLWEFAMLKLVETQRHDPDVPLDDRWPEVETWLTKWTAGKVARELSVPEGIAADLIAATKRRNVVAHHAWRFYIGARGKRGDAAVGDYCDWLDEEARMLGHAYNGVMIIRSALAASATPLATDAVLTLWRESVPQPIDEGAIPEPCEDATG